MARDGEVLPFRMHSLGAWTTGVVEVVPGVPASTIPAHLDQPRPDPIRWCVDCDGHRRSSFAIGDQPVTGVRPGDFLIGCAPAHEPRAHPPSITDRCRGGGVLIHELMQLHLLDGLRLFVHPLLLGTGKRLFRELSEPRSLHLVSVDSTPLGSIAINYTLDA